MTARRSVHSDSQHPHCEWGAKKETAAQPHVDSHLPIASIHHLPRLPDKSPLTTTPREAQRIPIRLHRLAGSRFLFSAPIPCRGSPSPSCDCAEYLSGWVRLPPRAVQAAAHRSWQLAHPRYCRWAQWRWNRLRVRASCALSCAA